MTAHKAKVAPAGAQKVGACLLACSWTRDFQRSMCGDGMGSPFMHPS